MDGQRTLWQAARAHLQNGDGVETLDLMHALKYLWNAAALLDPDADQATRRACTIVTSRLGEVFRQP